MEDKDAKKATIMKLDGTEINIKCSAGRYTNAEELATLLCDQEKVAPQDRPLFGLWVVSASLRT
jgi:hypothetical protein